MYCAQNISPCLIFVGKGRRRKFPDLRYAIHLPTHIHTQNLECHLCCWLCWLWPCVLLSGLEVHVGCLDGRVDSWTHLHVYAHTHMYMYMYIVPHQRKHRCPHNNHCTWPLYTVHFRHAVHMISTDTLHVIVQTKSWALKSIILPPFHSEPRGRGISAYSSPSPGPWSSFDWQYQTTYTFEQNRE
jgi:hypothetical protein